nr:hypothetical protein [Myxococcota bacterium]
AAYHRDAACTELAVVVERSRPLPDAVVATEADAGCTTYAELGAELPTAFTRSGESCIEVPLDDRRAFAVGAGFELPVFPRAPEPAAGHRLLREVLVDGGARFELPFRLLDTVTGVTCMPWAVAGTLRCLPTATSGFELMRVAYFTDAACLQPVELALHATGPCTPAPPLVLTQVGDRVEVQPLGEPHAGALFEISTADSCLPVIPPAHLTAYRLGPAIPSDSFPAATLVIE